MLHSNKLFLLRKFGLHFKNFVGVILHLFKNRKHRNINLICVL